nr:hypothetical protein GCM10020093_103960 [Planobispora longispora]
MSAHGAKITEVVEEVYTRVPEPAESDVLALPAGTHVLHVERTHWAATARSRPATSSSPATASAWSTPTRCTPEHP